MQSIAVALRRDPVLWAIAFLVALVHLACAGRYDFFRDELYFIICGRHPAFGYADQPALVPLLSAATQVFGENLFLLRLPAVLAAILIVPLTGALARLLGGNRAAVALAGAAAALSPLLTSMDVILFTSTFDALTWTGIAYFLMRAVLRAERAAPLWAGLIAGIAFETKYTVTFWLLALAIALVAMPERKLLAWRSFWLGLGLAMLLAAPSLIWQASNGWPFLTLISHHYGEESISSWLGFVLREALRINPFLAPFWLMGLIAPFVIGALKPARFLAIAFVLTFAIVLDTNGRDYYLVGTFPTMFAIGAVAIANWARWLRAIVMVGAVAEAAFVAPVVLPMLDPPALARYVDAVQPRPKPIQKSTPGLPPPRPQLASLTILHMSLLPLSFADQFGWRELEKKVAAVYQSLPPGEQAKAAVLTNNWGEAAALDFYGPADGLPPAISSHNQYFLWGPHDQDGEIVIILAGDLERWQSDCDEFTVVGLYGAPYAAGTENRLPIVICRGMKPGLRESWEGMKIIR